MTDTDNLLRIDPLPWMVDPATLAVIEALAAGGAQARFVGGSVRDALLGRRIGDIDIATPATPERVIELLEKRGIKVVPTGLAHGTVTANSDTSPWVRAAAWAESDQKFRCGGSWSLVRNATL